MLAVVLVKQHEGDLQSRDKWEVRPWAAALGDSELG